MATGENSVCGFFVGVGSALLVLPFVCGVSSDKLSLKEVGVVAASPPLTLAMGVFALNESLLPLGENCGVVCCGVVCCGVACCGVVCGVLCGVCCGVVGVCCSLWACAAFRNLRRVCISKSSISSALLGWGAELPKGDVNANGEPEDGGAPKGEVNVKGIVKIKENGYVKKSSLRYDCGVVL